MKFRLIVTTERFARFFDKTFASYEEMMGIAETFRGYSKRWWDVYPGQAILTINL